MIAGKNIATIETMRSHESEAAKGVGGFNGTIGKSISEPPNSGGIIKYNQDFRKSS